MRQKVYTVLAILAVLTLSACGHDDLKAPCSPVAALGNSPCMLMPVNLACL